MLELKDIIKVYKTGAETIEALKGVNINFRESEFVSILGPSGCGKTTLLNIIGGLDHCTRGDLIINGTSTKRFTDRDWDTYRNHSVGFVFQSYHLIPHQTVLQNVELALTLSGVSKTERRRRAKEALKEVGLETQLNKKPGELSGGQMQRVAIARAIVNDPDIILADEPTGALDTQTSIQVMNILKDLSKKRLVIMVTHNPELAEEYSTRIIRILDGKITDDSNPINEQAKQPQSTTSLPKGKKPKQKLKKPSMKLTTAFELSLKNLFTKKGRTMLTSVAGSIGIIGIALVIAVSQGATNYINSIQEDTLTSYPLTLEAQHADMSSLMQMSASTDAEEEEHGTDSVYQKSTIADLLNSVDATDQKENDLKSFKAYLEKEMADPNSTTKLNSAVTGVQYTYNFDLQVYSKNAKGEIINSDTNGLLQDILLEYESKGNSSTSNLSSQMATGSAVSSMDTSTSLWQEMLTGTNGEPINTMIQKQYDLVYGAWPTKYNEVVLVLDENNEINDLSLYALGLKTKEDIKATIKAVRDNKTSTKKKPTTTSKEWTYEDICNIDFKTVLNSDCYKYNKKTDTYTDLRDTTAGIKYLYNNALKLKVSGIIRPNGESSSNILKAPIAYTHQLTTYIIEHSKESKAVNAQLKDKHTDVLTGLPFEDTEGKLDTNWKTTKFKAHIKSLNDTQKAEAYIKIASIPTTAQINEVVKKTMNSLSKDEMKEKMVENLIAQMNVSKKDAENYVKDMTDKDINDTFETAIEEQFKNQYAAQVESELSSVSKEQLAAKLDSELADYTVAQCAKYYDNVLTFSDSTYEDNLSKLGYADIDDPSSINIYTSSFENKDVIVDAIDSYNKNVDRDEEIAYTDYVGLIMSSVTTIINAITYILIAFIAVSLIVSSIMIGIITLISVQERTKEIGILRAIGASKKNISNMFNAETVIIGFASGLIGVLITYLLCLPINAILHAITEIETLNAQLPIQAAIVLVIISMLLTLISGIIPSKSAATKDPVVALRTE